MIKAAEEERKQTLMQRVSKFSQPLNRHVFTGGWRFSIPLSEKFMGNCEEVAKRTPGNVVKIDGELNRPRIYLDINRGICYKCKGRHETRVCRAQQKLFCRDCLLPIAINGKPDDYLEKHKKSNHQPSQDPPLRSGCSTGFDNRCRPQPKGFPGTPIC